MDSRPSISTAPGDLVPRTSDDAPTPRAQWNPTLETHQPAMDYLSPDMAPSSRTGSRKGKGRAVDDGEALGGYEEPEYLTVRRHNSRTRSVDGHEVRDGREVEYTGREDLEMGMQGLVGNRDGVGVVDLENAGSAYPPVSEEDAEERRIKDVSLAASARVL